MSRDDTELQEILERIKTNTPSHPGFTSKVLTREVKTHGNYETGELLFEYLINVLREKKVFKSTYIYSEMEISAFQRAVATLVRYAPTTDKARYFFNLTLSDFEPPFRTISLELTLLNNLLYVHSQFKEMKEALELIKTALEIGVFQLDLRNHPDLNNNIKFSNPLEVFETLSGKVLRFYRMEFNEDKTELRALAKQYSR